MIIFYEKDIVKWRDGNFGSRSARVLLERYPHEALIFTALTKNGLEKYQAMDIETRIVDFNNAEKLTAFQGQRRKCGRTRRRTSHFAQMEWCPLAGQSV